MIKGNGFNVLGGAVIYSSYVETLSIELNGTNKDNIVCYCNETSICNIYCQSQSACSNMYLYCFGTCNVDCGNQTGMFSWQLQKFIGVSSV